VAEPFGGTPNGATGKVTLPNWKEGFLARKNPRLIRP